MIKTSATFTKSAKSSCHTCFFIKVHKISCQKCVIKPPPQTKIVNAATVDQTANFSRQTIS